MVNIGEAAWNVGSPRQVQGGITNLEKVPGADALWQVIMLSGKQRHVWAVWGEPCDELLFKKNFVEGCMERRRTRRGLH